jgi:universal stress protein A
MDVPERVEAMIQYLREKASRRCANNGAGEELPTELEQMVRALRAELQVPAAAARTIARRPSILVAIDRDEPSQWAFSEAVGLAKSLDGRVSLIHVIDLPPALAPELAFDAAAARPGVIREGYQLLHDAAAHVPAPWRGVQVLREGEAAKQIVLAAQELRADLLVIGTHGRGLLGRFLLGSVAESVIRHAPCPVITVAHPRGRRAERRGFFDEFRPAPPQWTTAQA